MTIFSIIIAIFIYMITIGIALAWFENKFKYDGEVTQWLCAIFWIIVIPILILVVLPTKAYNFFKTIYHD